MTQYVPKVKDILDPLPEGYLHRIGWIVTRWAMVEYGMDSVLFKALRIDHKTGREKLENYRTSQFVEKLERYLAKEHVVVTPHIEGLHNDLVEMERERDRLAHNLWIYNGKGIPSIRYTRGRWQIPGTGETVEAVRYPRAIAYEIASLDGIIDTLGKLVDRLEALEHQVVAALEASSKTNE